MIKFEKLVKQIWVSFITLTAAKRIYVMLKNYQNKKNENTYGRPGSKIHSDSNRRNKTAVFGIS